jgi:hydrogenase maturation protease
MNDECSTAATPAQSMARQPSRSASRPIARLLIAGLGSPHGDDQAGWAVVDRLRRWLPSGADARKVATPLDLVELLGRRQRLIVIDAAQLGEQPGALRHFRWPCTALAGSVEHGTHGLGLVEALRLAEALGWLPAEIDLYTVQAQDVSAGHGLSLAVRGRIEELADMILQSIRDISPTHADA